MKHLLALLLAPAIVFGAGETFEVASEQPILDIPRGNASGDYGAVSPDGKSVLIIHFGALSIRPIDSPKERQLLPTGSVSVTIGGAGASWSAEGKWIYYPKRGNTPVMKDDLWRLEVTDPKSAARAKNELLIHNAGDATSGPPLPSPDGASIAFCRNNTLFVVNAQGQDERVLLERHERFGLRIWNMAWSPDSTQILVPHEPPKVPKGSDFARFDLLDVATKQLKPLPQWKGPDPEDQVGVISVAWPSWSSGPFVCLMAWQRGWFNMSLRNSHIWHLGLAQQQWTEVTQDPRANYLVVFGAGAEGHSLIVQRMPPPEGALEGPLNFLASKLGVPVAGRPTVMRTVLLTLKQ